MRTNDSRQSAMEERLRQGVPPLRAPDRARVDKACARLAATPPLSPLREARTFLRPLLRVAACLALVSGLALLLRPAAPRPAEVPALPSVTLSGLTGLVNTPPLESALAVEAADLAADLVDLTLVLNDRAQSILF